LAPSASVWVFGTTGRAKQHRSRSRFVVSGGSVGAKTVERHRGSATPVLPGAQERCRIVNRSSQWGVRNLSAGGQVGSNPLDQSFSQIIERLRVMIESPRTDRDKVSIAGRTGVARTEKPPHDGDRGPEMGPYLVPPRYYARKEIRIEEVPRTRGPPGNRGDRRCLVWDLCGPAMNISRRTDFLCWPRASAPDLKQCRSSLGTEFSGTTPYEGVRGPGGGAERCRVEP
jgi:hypothetical protein